ncbi:MAG: TatD family hydrolase [Bacteroidia bacterium]
MEFIDTHTHLFAEEFYQDRNEVLERALKAKVTRMLLPNIDSSSIQALKDTVAISPEHFIPMMGLHPSSVKEDYINELELIEKELFSQYPYKGVGEIGIDLYWDKSTLEIQKKAFVKQCEWAVELDLAVSMHTREANREVLDCLKSMNVMPKGVFHCFSGTIEEAKEVIELGFKLGIGGVVSFKNSNLPELLKEIPLDRIVLETDSPYLAPMPYRGKRNESSYIPFIAEKLSDIYNVSIEQIAIQTSTNAMDVFNL